MKISELLEDVSFDVKPGKGHASNYQGALDIRSQRPGSTIKRLGSGKYANAYSQKDPNQVLKIGRVAFQAPEYDAYLKFLKGIQGMHNPFFPQLDELRLTKKGNIVSYKIRMEKLTSLNDASFEELEAMARKCFDSESADNMVEAAEKSTNPTKRLVQLLSETIENAVDNPSKYAEYITNDALLEAVQVLNKMLREGLINDLHEENIMFRLTSTGPQPVITDPFTSLNAPPPEYYSSRR